MPADLVAILQSLRLQLLSLSVTAPYYRPRLLRSIEQLEYVVGEWPLKYWPTSPAPTHGLLRQARSYTPSRQQLRQQLLTLKRALRDEEQVIDSYPQHQLLLDLILCLL
ncbi:hypothetical protein [Hymenobacter crusticola]|uniref:Uncharacterized protein n=1 Tax=Hymenobacter crusticola TaxID=1770526 RepID=A0A243W5C0_9BACT|nr:hypothetical protein [Hymenobacter crusticola]OUJ68003.1 hypothetical protein BXP70_28300 [Hymenobacter crusticola]